MKLLVITSLKEYLPAISALLKEARVVIFSVSRITGMKTGDGDDLLEDWFGNKSGEFDSIFVFSFTEDDKALSAMALVENYNRAGDTRFPVRAFVLPVERSNQ